MQETGATLTPDRTFEQTAKQTYEAFRTRMPHELIETNLNGAFATPAPPLGFSLAEASASALFRHGIFLRRPTAQDPPEVHTAWDELASREWKPEDRIVPHLEVQPGVTHRRSVVHRENKSVTSNNWAGASIKGSWSAATGSWVVPAVTKPTEPQGSEGGWNSTSWVGLDGAYGSTDVLQAGVQQQIDGSGNVSYTAWFEWFAPHKNTMTEQSPLTPSIASLNGKLYLAWKGNGNNQLNVSMSADNGSSFTQKFTSSELSSDGPALAAHNDQLFISWRGDGNSFINVAVVTLDGVGAPTGFANKRTLSEKSAFSPALASTGRDLYLAWRGDGNDQLNVMRSGDNGNSFGQKWTSSEASSEPPALASFNGRLFMAWKGASNSLLNVAQVAVNPGPVGLSGKVTLGELSAKGPALAQFGRQLYIAWKGDGNDQINLMTSADGQNLTNKFTTAEFTSERPSMTSDGTSLYFGWKGSGNRFLNVATLVELLSPPPAYVFQTNIPNFPVSAGDSVSCSVQYIGKTGGQINFANTTKGKNFSITLAPPSTATFSGNSAEWIMEAPDFGYPVSALPKFTPVVFTNALACSAVTGGLGGNPLNGDTWTVVNNAVSLPQTLTAESVSNASVTVTFTG